MKRSILITILLMLTAIAGIAGFFMLGGQTTSPATKDFSVLDVEDKRLTKGNDSAPVAIVEYADMLCPFCAIVNEEVMPLVQADYIDTDKARYEIRLVAMIAPDSQRAAEGAYCAAEQNKFWDYTDLAYKVTLQDYYSQNKKPHEVPIFSDTQINQFAGRVGLEVSLWRECLDSGKYAEVIEKNQATMSEMKAYGTPHFIFNDQSYSGAPPYPLFQKALDAEYNKKIQG